MLHFYLRNAVTEIIVLGFLLLFSGNHRHFLFPLLLWHWSTSHARRCEFITARLVWGRGDLASTICLLLFFLRGFWCVWNCWGWFRSRKPSGKHLFDFQARKQRTATSQNRMPHLYSAWLHMHTHTDLTFGKLLKTELHASCRRTLSSWHQIWLYLPS